MGTRAAVILAISIFLSGCFSAESLRKNADEKLSSCLRVGMSRGAAEKCTKEAGLTFIGWPHAAPSVRIYQNSAMSAEPFVVAIVRVELRFNQAGELQSWNSRSSYDGI